MSSTASQSLRTLGNSDLQLTPIGFGAWAIGGGNWDFGWGPQDDNESIAAIHRALDLGVNWIDTAAIYGLGRSEEVVARALKELEASLRRLGVETIDLYQIHWPIPDPEIEEGWEALARFRKQGKVRWIGVSNFSVEQMKRIQKIAPITSLQPPYSLLRRAVEDEILLFTQANGIGVINYSPMVSGLLTGKMTAERIAGLPTDDWRRRSPEFNQPKLNHNLQLVELLREIGDGHGVSPGVVAVAWTLNHPAITAAIVGGRSAQQVEGLAPALEFRLTAEEYARINAFVAAGAA